MPASISRLLARISIIVFLLSLALVITVSAAGIFPDPPPADDETAITTGQIPERFGHELMAARNIAVAQLDLPHTSVTSLAIKQVEWPDKGWGCPEEFRFPGPAVSGLPAPQPDEHNFVTPTGDVIAERIGPVPGFLVTVRAVVEIYHVHMNDQGKGFLCLWPDRDLHNPIF